MVASTLVTSRRPRDYDVEALRAAGNFLARGDRGMLLRLYICMHYLDTGEIEEAIASLGEAEGLYEGLALQSPAGTCAVFVFLNAIYKRDRAAAELWWQRLQAQRNIDLDAEYWQARAGLLWMQGQTDEARSACEHGYALALELPAAGAYDYTRSGFDAVRNALDEPSPGLAEMLTAINSEEGEGEAPEAETPEAEIPAVTDPAL
jgi:tetratricopeptide (TPR) repeat protein